MNRLRRTQLVLGDLLQEKYNALRPCGRDAMKQCMAEMRTCRMISAGGTFEMYSNILETAALAEPGSVGSTDRPSSMLPAFEGYGIADRGVQGPLERRSAIPISSAQRSIHHQRVLSPPVDGFRLTIPTAWDVPIEGVDAPRSSAPRGIPALSTPFGTDRMQVYQRRRVEETQAMQTDLPAATGILQHVSVNYSSSYADDCASLLDRFSISSSDDTIAKPVLTGDRRSAAGDEERVAPRDRNAYLLSESDESALSEAPINTRTYWFRPLPGCCRTSVDCIHRYVEGLTKQYPANEECRLSLSVSDAKRRDIFGNSTLHIAANWGTTFPVFQSLIFAGADVLAVNSAGQTFLHLLDATILLRDKSWFFWLIRLLRNRDFPFDARDECGQTFLHTFLRNPEHRKIVDPDFIERLLDLTVTDQNVWTLVHARDNGGLNVPALLHGPNTHRIPVHGRQLIVANPAYQSTLQKYYLHTTMQKCVELIPSGSCIIDQQYFLRYHHLFRNLNAPGNIELSNTLHQLAYPPGWPIVVRYAFDVIQACAADPSRYKLIDDIIDAGVDVNGYDGKSITPLMAFICGFGSKENDESDTDIRALVAYLISRGADIHRRDLHGETVLHKAVQRGLKCTTELLLNRGSNVHARRDDGQSVLSGAYKALERAEPNESLYARVLACLTMVIHRGGVANPSMEQERGFTDPTPRPSVQLKPPRKLNMP